MNRHRTLMMAHRYLCGAAAIIQFLCAMPCSAGQANSEWILQQHKDMQGDLTAYVSHDAVKIVNPKWGYQVVARAPDWTVHCFRPAEKIEWTGELNTFTGDMMENPVPSGIVDENRLVPIGSGVEGGLRYTKYAHSPRTSLVVYGADDMAVSAKAAECLCRFYDIP